MDVAEEDARMSPLDMEGIEEVEDEELGKDPAFQELDDLEEVSLT